MHHRFEAVHPFVDGNGRVGRLDLYLEACQGVPAGDYVPLALLATTSGYSVNYLGWLVRQGRITACRFSPGESL